MSENDPALTPTRLTWSAQTENHSGQNLELSMSNQFRTVNLYLLVCLFVFGCAENDDYVAYENPARLKECGIIAVTLDQQEDPGQETEDRLMQGHIRKQVMSLVLIRGWQVENPT